MCDALSFLSAGAQIGGMFGEMAGIEANRNIQQAQLDAMAFMATAETREQQSDLYKMFEEQAGMNLAAAAGSGLAIESFDAIEKGNEKNLQLNLERAETSLEREKGKIAVQKAVVDAEAAIAKSAAKFSGVFGAFDTLYAAEQSYRKTNTGESRIEAFQQSMRFF